MAAYFIVHYQLNDPALYGEYVAGAGATIGDYGGELVVFDTDVKAVEGEPPGPRTVIVRFESAQAANDWYNSPEYQAVVGKRLAATEGFAVIARSQDSG